MIVGKDMFNLNSLKPYAIAFIIIGTGWYYKDSISSIFTNNDSENSELSDQEIENYLKKAAENFCHQPISNQEKAINSIVFNLSVQNIVQNVMKNRKLSEEDFKKELFQSIRVKALSENIHTLDGKPQSSLTTRYWKKAEEFIGFITEDFDNYLIATEILSGREPPMTRMEASTTEGYIKNNFFLALGLGNINKKMTALFLGLTCLWSGVRKGYVRWVKKAPTALTPLSLYTDNSINSSQPFVGRDDVFKKILEIWNQKKHPILVGEPGTGKTSILMKLGLMISRGEFPEFNSTKMFGGSAAMLIGNPMGPSFEYIIKECRQYRDNIIIGLDEVHNLALDPKKNYLQTLRSALDNSTDSLRYCILATTPSEYKKYIEADTSLGRRLVPIEIESLKKEELLKVMYNEALETFPILRINDKAMETIYEIAKGQQNASRQLMHKVLIKAENRNQTSPKREKLSEKQKALSLLRTHYSTNGLTMTADELKNQHDKIIRLEIEVENLEKQCSEEEKPLRKHKQLCIDLVETWNRELSIAKNLFESFIKEKEKVEEEDFHNYLKEERNISSLKEYLFLEYSLLPKYKEAIQETEKQNSSLISIINEKFVIEVLEKEIKEQETKELLKKE